jgi:hypothetical protein
MSYIIHQIWIGPAAPPVFWMATVRDFATQYGYTYMLWTDKEVSKLTVRNTELLREFLDAKRWPGASDIIRCEVLGQYGGVYIDADSVVMKPDAFHAFLQTHKDQTFFGCEYDDCHLLANGTIGSPKGSAFMRDLLQAMPAYAKERPDEPDYKKVGPYFLTDFVKHRKETDYVKIPRTVFYPQSWHGINDPWLHTKTPIPDESLLWQYGYSTNGFGTIFKQRNSIALVLAILLVFVVLLSPLPQTYVSYVLGFVIFLAILIKTYYIH